MKMHFWLIICGLIILLPGCDWGCGKYQVASYGNHGAIVIDTRSGEAWTIDGEIKGAYDAFEPRFTPALYSCEKKQRGLTWYTPDNARSSESMNWWQWLKKTIL